MIVARIIKPQSKLATARSLKEHTATSSHSLELDIERELYEAMDWLGARQGRIENKLAKKHLRDGSLILYDVGSSFYTGSHCPLVMFGHNRDGKNGYPQIVYGLLCNSAGCPVAIEVFEGNTSDSKTVEAQVEKIRRRFHIEPVVLVGDRGMITTMRIDETLRDIEGLEWISALRAAGIKKLVEQGTIEPSLFDDDDKASAELLRSPIVALAQRSERAKAKDRTKRTEDDLAVHSFQTLIDDLATLAKNRISTDGATPCEFYELTQATEVQRRAFELLGVTPLL